MGKCILAGHPPVGGQIGYGTYTGNGAASQTISLGVTPKWVLVLPADARLSDFTSVSVRGGLALYGLPAQVSAGKPIVQIGTNGFTVYYDAAAGIFTNGSYPDGAYRFIYGF